MLKNGHFYFSWVLQLTITNWWKHSRGWIQGFLSFWLHKNAILEWGWNVKELTFNSLRWKWQSLCILALFCPLAGSKWYFTYSYTCCKTCVRVINASFDPPLDIVSVKKYSKNIPLTTPLTKIFFEEYIIDYICLTVDIWASISLVEHRRMSSYILSCSLPKVNVDRVNDIGSNLRFEHEDPDA